ncbi:MAG TPA: hypothetical protein VKC59_06735 [Candidatus Limnocylindrales bacterium]|nr:hypothetical protein [Candidatus Limnocylindrales bacterium]
MSEAFEHIGTGDDELDWRLHAFIAARLSPSTEASRRMRNGVVARAADAAAIRAFEAERLALQEAQRHQAQRGLAGFLRLYTRRGAAAFLAGSMVFGSGVAVLAAAPSSPLYGARIWLETALLPASGDARAAAHVGHLEARVEDAEHAIGGGDPNGAATALSAYIAELELAINDAGDDPAKLAALKSALNAHLLLLEQLEQDAPAGAQNAIHTAINDSRKASKEIDSGAGRPAATPAPQPPDDGGGQNSGGQQER